MFDTYLRESAQQTGRPFVAFSAADYEEYVDGKPRYDGVRSFLNSRGIELPEGQDEDPPDAVTVRGLGNRKNEIFTRLVREDGVEAYPGSVRYLRAARGPASRRDGNPFAAGPQRTASDRCPAVDARPAVLPRAPTGPARGLRSGS